MSRIQLTIFLVFSFSLLMAQPVDIIWQNTIGGDSSDWHRLTLETSDGGLILGGFSDSDASGDKTENNNGIYDYWVVKLDINRQIEWQNSIGGSVYNQLWSMVETDDQGYLLVGGSDSDISGDKTEDTIGTEGLKDFWIVKIDSNGLVEWDETIGGSNSDEAFIVQNTLDNAFVIAGVSNSNISGDKTENSKGFDDYWVMKIDSNGSIVWQKTIGGSSFENLRNVIVAEDGGFLLVGTSSSDISGDKTENSKGGIDYWLVKIDSLGEIEWDKTFGGSETERCIAGVNNGSGGYLIAGHSWSGISGDKTEQNYGDADIWVLNIDEEGSIIWQNTIGGEIRDEVQANKCLLRTATGEYIIGATSDSNAGIDKSEDSRGGPDFWIIKLDEFGNVLWDKTIGGDGIDYTRSLIEYQNKLFVSGRSDSSISGDKTVPSAGRDYWLLELDGALSIDQNELLDAISVHPNPVDTILNFQLHGSTIDLVKIFDISGRLVLSNEPKDSSIDLSILNSGTYLVEFVTGETSTVKKVVKN